MPARFPADRPAPPTPHPHLKTPDSPTEIPDLQGKRVAVTGATGFLGGHVLHQLAAANAIVLAVVDRARAHSRHPAPSTAVDTLHFDTPGQLADTVRAARPDYVIHLHAEVTTARTTDAVHSTLRSNVLPSLDLMAACADIAVQRLILMGSGEEFGPVTGSFDNSTVADPPSPYGASKAAITCYAKMFHRAFHLPVTVLRPAVIYGPYQAPRMLIPQVMHALRDCREIPVTEGRQTRDFIYVEDVARGIVAALTAPGIDGRSYNLGSGEIVTVRDCLSRIGAITGRLHLIRYGALPYKSGEVFTNEPIVEETYEAFRWRPTVSLDQGLALTWNSLQQHGETHQQHGEAALPQASV